MLNVEYSPTRRGGVAAASTKSREATERCRRPGGQLGEIFQPEQFRRTDHHLRLRPIGLALRARRQLLLSCRVPPPSARGEYWRDFNSFTDLHRPPLQLG